MDIAGELKKGLGLHQAGRLAEAGDTYAGILEAEPDNADALNLMGVVLQAAGGLRGAPSGCSGGPRNWPPSTSPPTSTWATPCKARAGLDDALEALQAALILNPESPAALNNLASVLNGPRPPPGGRGRLRPAPWRVRPASPRL